MKVFLTGITGLLGNEIAEQLLHKGYQVRALIRDIRKAKLHHLNLEYVQGNLDDVLGLSELTQGFDYLIHAAAVVSFAPKDRDILYKSNVEGTANIVNVCLENKIKKLCYISSIAAFGRPPLVEMKKMDRVDIDENQKWSHSETNSNYAITKHLAELEVWRGYEEGLEMVIVNPSIILGEGDWNRSSAELFKYVYDQRPFFPEGYLNYVDVRDVTNAAIQMVESEISGERYCLSAGMISYKVFFDKIAERFQKRKPWFKVTSSLMSLIWRFEAFKSFFTGKAPLITKETARTAQLKIFQKNDKVIKDLNFRFTPLEETLDRVCQNLLLINKKTI